MTIGARKVAKKAEEFDEKHHITATARAKALEVDEKTHFTSNMQKATNAGLLGSTVLHGVDVETGEEANAANIGTERVTILWLTLHPSSVPLPRQLRNR